MVFSIFTVVKGLLILVVYFGFALQQYIIVEMTYPSIKISLLKIRVLEQFQITRSVIPEISYRVFLVILEMGFAIAIPNLEQIIPLVGVTAGMFLALVFPAMLDSVTFLPEMLHRLQNESKICYRRIRFAIVWRIFQNICLVGLGIFGSVAGLQSSIRDLIKD